MDVTTAQQSVSEQHQKECVPSPQKIDRIRLSFHKSINLSMESCHACISGQRPRDGEERGPKVFCVMVRILRLLLVCHT
jgi:hypothetical protein